jgi:hypothetical protein
VFFGNRGKNELKKSIGASKFSLKWFINIISELKIGLSPISMNQLPPQTDGTENKQKIFLKLISNKVS